MLPDATYRNRDDVHLARSVYEKESFKRVIELIAAQYGNQPFSLIDVGCATGGFLYHAHRRLNVRQSVGMDVSEPLLEQARRNVPDANFVCDSIEAPQRVRGGEFDVCTCIGVTGMFDDIGDVVANLLSLLRPGGMLYVVDAVNQHPVDLLTRYRLVSEQTTSEWYAGLNIRSKRTWDRAVRAGGGSVSQWVDFEMPFPIEKTDDPMRTWTMRTERKERQELVGTGQLLDFKILEVRK